MYDTSCLAEPDGTRLTQLRAFFDGVATLYPTLKWEERCVSHVQTIKITVPAKSARRLRERLNFALEGMKQDGIWTTLVFIDSGLYTQG